MTDIEVPKLNTEPESSSDTFERIKVGAGANSINMDERGFWIGADTPEQAAFYVDPNGNMTINSQSVKGRKFTISSQELKFQWHDGKNDRILIKV